MEDKKVGILSGDLYRLLVSELRYAYTWNNWRQPSGSYDDVRRLLPHFLEADADFALSTAKQLCEECISEYLALHFFDGLDDENGNRALAVDFIEWLLKFVHENGDKAYIPYNIDLYRWNIEKHSKLRYALSRLVDGSSETILIGSEPEINAKLFHDILKADSFVPQNKTKLKNSSDRIIGEVFTILEPADHSGEVYKIELEA